jgi:hypothetical protein
MKEYKDLLKAVEIFLKQEGLTKKGNTYYLAKDGNLGVINFQRSRDMIEGGAKFTINLGVFSSKLSEALPYGIKGKPAIEDCHWRIRAGYLLPQKQDHWWIVVEGQPIENLATEIIAALEAVLLPELKRSVSDESLKNKWMDSVSGGITEFQRFVFLTTLLKLDKDERLKNVVDDFVSLSKGRSMEASVQEHVKELGV